MSIRVLQLHKRSSYEFKYIQDKYALNANAHLFALADGTTQSFNSEIWADIITSEFIINPKFKPNDLITSFKNNVSKYKDSKFEFSTNPAKASLEKEKISKGGTATFIGIQIFDEKQIKIITCGDSCVFIINNLNQINPIPFADVDALDANTHFINTEHLLQNKIDENYFKVINYEFKPDDIIILATDALSRLILKNPNTITELLNVNTFGQLYDYCIKYWENKELQEDDITAIIIPINNNGLVDYIQPPIEFSFPREKEAIFIPRTILNETTINPTVMDINEIRNQFNGVAHDFYSVKRKLWIHNLLIVFVIILLMLNMVVMYFLQTMNANKNNNKYKSDKSVISKLKNNINDLDYKNQTLEIKIKDLQKLNDELKKNLNSRNILKVENKKPIIIDQKNITKKPKVKAENKQIKKTKVDIKKPNDSPKKELNEPLNNNSKIDQKPNNNNVQENEKPK